MSDWNPIETAPHGEQIDVYGWRLQGQSAPGGPYRHYWMTVGEISAYTGECADLLAPGDGVFAGDIMPNPTHWRPRPIPPASK
jgi:hypothetical protein